MDTFKDTLNGTTHLPNVKCSNNELTTLIGTVTDDGVRSPTGEKLEFFLRGTTPPDIPVTFNRDCQMIYNDGRQVTDVDKQRRAVFTRPAAPKQPQQEAPLYTPKDLAEINELTLKFQKAMDAHRTKGATEGATDGGRKLTRRIKSKSKSKSKSKKKRRSSHRRH
jgi:hypothetical protein